MHDKIRAAYMRSFALVLICASISSVFGQSTLLKGLISDSISGEPVVFASLTYAPGQGVQSDLNGRYSIRIPNGEHSVMISSVGYERKRISIQLEGGERTLDIQLKPSSEQLKTVVVSAGRFEQEIGEVPVSLNVIRPELIRNKGVTTMQDAIDQTPGVIVVDNDPQIRASSGYSFGAGSRVQVLIDDIPVLSGDVGRPQWSFLPLENVEQVEVIKGASSVLYGSAALSGVINIRTAYPRAEPRTRVSLLGGVRDAPGQEGTKWWDENRPTLTGLDWFHSRRIGNMDLVLGGNWLSDIGYVGPEPIDPDSLASDPLLLGPGGYEHRIRMNAGLRWRNAKKEGLYYGFNANAMDNRNSSVLAWNDVDSGLYRPFPGTLTRTHSTTAYLDPFIEYTGNSGTKHTLRTRLYHLNNRNDNEQSNRSNVVYGEYKLGGSLDLSGPLRYTLGVMSSFTNASSELYAGDTTNAGDHDASNQAIFLQLDRKLLLDRLNLTAGVRYERFTVNDDEEGVPVFRAGASYQVLKGTFLRGSWGQGFRFPTIGERFIQTSVGQLNIYPSFDLVPERSWNLEFGLKQGFRIGSFEGYLDGAWFNQEYAEYIEFTFGQWGTVQTPAALFGLGFRSVNTGKARVSGFELEAAGRGKIGDWELMLLAGYTHADPITLDPDFVYAESAPANPPQPQFPASTYANTSYDPSGNTLKYRVEDLFRSDLQANKDKWGFGISVRYNSHVRNIDLAFISLDESGLFPTGVEQWMEEHTTGDLLMDLRIQRKLSEEIDLAFIIDNVTNEVYSVRPLFIEAPRTFNFRLTFQQ